MLFPVSWQVMLCDLFRPIRSYLPHGVGCTVRRRFLVLVRLSAALKIISMCRDTGRFSESAHFFVAFKTSSEIERDIVVLIGA